ncbi:hypothetical protein [Microcoleus vaginatus]|uniref:hypothetical protein n=1 Tax=Microcoleus vaginatus TaxID=119532 RepID=UPI0016859553|nr:hypothetical protein [Microcoleus sp. FACHB-84]
MSASDGYGKAAHARSARPYTATHHPHRAFGTVNTSDTSRNAHTPAERTRQAHGVATAFSVSRNSFVRFSSIPIPPDSFPLILANTTNKVGFS